MADAVVVGGGGHASVLVDVLHRLGHRVIGYTAPDPHGARLTVPYLGRDEELADRVAVEDVIAVLGLGKVGVDDGRMTAWAILADQGLRFPPVVAPSAVVQGGVDLGAATVVLDGAVVATGSRLGRGCIVNTNASVDHGCSLDDDVHVAPGATVSGDVTIGRDCLIGVGAAVIQGVTHLRRHPRRRGRHHRRRRDRARYLPRHPGEARAVTSAPRTWVIAEAGVNHDGSPERALELVDAAQRAGADAVKFQTFRADRLVTAGAAKAAYQRTTVPGDEGQYAMLKALELGEAALRRVRDRCDEVGIEFLSSPFDAESADLLDALGMRTFKVPSGEITNLPFLRHLGAKRKPVILSTGMAWLGEVETAVRTLQGAGATDVTLLHCVTEYPAPIEQVNLRAMHTLREAFGLPVGYSDHTTGIEASIAAVALGATVVEKHFTLDATLPGPDHKASLEPPAFAEMVAAIRRVEAALGDGRKQPAPCELANLTVVRKSLVAARDLVAGTRLGAADLAAKRPATGIAPTAWDEVVGRVLRRDVRADELLRWDDLA